MNDCPSGCLHKSKVLHNDGKESGVCMASYILYSGKYIPLVSSRYTCDLGIYRSAAQSHKCDASYTTMTQLFDHDSAAKELLSCNSVCRRVIPVTTCDSKLNTILLCLSLYHEHHPLFHSMPIFNSLLSLLHRRKKLVCHVIACQFWANTIRS